MFTGAYLNTAVSLLETYTGGIPFHLYLKAFFLANKKFGSRDRKYITQLCYCWFRAGHALRRLAQQDQFIYALFLCSNENKLLQQLAPDLNKEAAKPISEKLQFMEKQVGFELQQLFPWNAELSTEIESAAFNQSLLIQPDLFLRLRPGKQQVVKTALQDHAIPFEIDSTHCLRVSNSAKVDAVLKLDEEAVVQDLNSQKLLDLVVEAQHGDLKKFAVWDCCAASGGKSLLVSDLFSNVQLTVSDVRPGILHNLQKRFQKAGINGYQWFVGDAGKDAPPRHQKFDLIICDAPCSGSGTWSRTPEQLHYFPTEKITMYAQLQKAITGNASRYLKSGGLFLYSTCSVFKEENEAVVAALSTNHNMRFLKSAYYKGYDKKADTLFAALFKAL